MTPLLSLWRVAANFKGKWDAVVLWCHVQELAWLWEPLQQLESTWCGGWCRGKVGLYFRSYHSSEERPSPHPPPAVYFRQPSLPLSGGGSFDLILAADVVWLDDLVEPLVRTLERLTADWSPPCNDGDREPQQTTTAPPQPPPSILAPSNAAAAQEQQALVEPEATHLAAVALENSCTDTAGRLRGSATTAIPSREHEESRIEIPRPRQQRAGVGRRRVLLAYQWRSERTGKALLEELAKAFFVREIPPEVRAKNNGLQ